MPGPKVQEIHPDAIRFSQRTVSGLKEIVRSMRANRYVGAPIDVVKMADGGLVTLDNTRVLAASQAVVNVWAIVHEAGEALPPSQIQRFTTAVGAPSTWGEAAALRIQNQGAGFSGRRPNGSPYTEVR